MSKLNALRKQIAALEARAERLTKLEMTSSITKVKELMHSLGVTIDHLGSNVSKVVKKVAASKSAPAKKARAKQTGVGVAKYIDPKSGKTWTGFGRAPAWIASAKSRDAFLVHKTAASDAVAPAKKATRAAKKVAAKVATKAKTAAKKVTRTAKAATPALTKASAPAKGRVAKTASAKKAVARQAPAKKAALNQADAAGAPAAQ